MPYDWSEALLEDRAMERVRGGEAGVRFRLLRRQWYISPIDRVDIGVLWDRHVLIIECKKVVDAKAVVQLERYLTLARVIWPDRDVYGLLYGIERRLGLETDIPVFLEPEAPSFRKVMPRYFRMGDF